MKKFFNGKSDVNGTNAARSGDAQATDRRNEKRRVLLNKNYELRETFDK